MKAKNRTDGYIPDDSNEDEVDYQDEDWEFEFCDNGDLSSSFTQHAFVRAAGT